MNVYALREKTNNLYLSKHRGRWCDKLSTARLFTSISDAKKMRKISKDKNEISAAKIEIVEYELIERKTL